MNLQAPFTPDPKKVAEVDALWEKVKDYPNLDKALNDLEKAGWLRPIVVVFNSKCKK